mmetsp:Transcript_1551/g.3176  ORF Transcript_1551/g.3176 Transcript_1551/m.3176 type:complete len:554 (+) Transcript_1551:52-1713(+)
MSLQACLAPYGGGRCQIKRLLEAGLKLAGQPLTVAGWVKTGRTNPTFAFLELNDGSCPMNLQAVVDAEVHNLKELTTTGTCLVMEGALQATPEGTKTPFEFKVSKVKSVGQCEGRSYPMAKGKLGLEFLRTQPHLRIRTNTFQAIARIRNTLSYATHEFFQMRNFLYVHTPLITASDCEGAGEMFQVTTMLAGVDQAVKSGKTKPTEAELATAREGVVAIGNQIRDMKAAGAKAKDSKLKAAVQQLTDSKAQLADLEKLASGGLPRKADGTIDYTDDFFGKAAFLSVSGQLQVETYCCSMSSVYTFGPTFRAENSHTSRHISEFWMIEPELAFADLEDNMRCAEDYVQHCCKRLLEKNLPDMEFIVKMYDKEAIDRTKKVAESPFARCSYTDAVKKLQEAIKGGHQFEVNEVNWGDDLGSEHERFLSEQLFKCPVIVYNYPKAIKSFYMRENDPGTDGAPGPTVAAMDVLVPKVGELIGGSQREERYDALKGRIEEMGLTVDDYSWYMDLRKFGTCTHSGFGLGFERLIMFCTGVENIRDVIPFPRTPGTIWG